MPRSSKAWRGAEALWITVAGWSAAAKRFFGSAWVMTSDAIVEPEAAIHYPIVGTARNTSSKKNWIPTIVKTAVKDYILWRQTKQFRNKEQERSWRTSIKFVWEQHDLFPGPGKKLASSLQVPFIIYVHAPVVWEASKWGVKRPLWGKILENLSEKKSLKGADIVACVSEEVASKLESMGIERSKILVSPMAVDPTLFEVSKSNNLRASLGLQEKFVIGWTGSFRSFHGLDLLIQAFAKMYEHHPECVLLLVGDGAERSKMEALADSLDLTKAIRFTGRVSFTEIPGYISIFDVAVVSARSAADFHYSPLKLREYLAAGIPTLAPCAGDMVTLFENEKHLLLYTVGEVDDTAECMTRLIEDRALLQKLGDEGKKYALTNCTWDYELSKLLTSIQTKLKPDLTTK